MKITLFVNPTDVLNQLNLNEDMTAADFGSGSGGWVLPLAKILEHGFVFAVDIQEEALSALSGKARQLGLKNIRTILADIEAGHTQISQTSCDLVLITNLLFQVENREAVFSEAKRVLKPGGRALVVDWKEDAVLGPKQGKVSEQQVKEIAQKTGLRFEKDLGGEVGIYHYGLVFIKTG